MFENLDDPKTQLLMMMGLGLLGGAPGQRKNFGADLAHGGLLGLQGYGQAKQQQARQAERKQAQEWRDMQMAREKRGMEREDQISGLAQRAFGPNPNLVANDDMGSPMPQAPGGGGMQEFAQGMMGIDPFRAAQLMPKPKMGFAPNGQAVDMNDLKPGTNYAPPQKPTGPQEGQTRELKSGRRILTQEFQGGQWKTIADSAMDKPDGPEKPEKAPQGYRYAGDRLEPIPGGPADTKAGKEAEAIAKRTEGALARADFVLGNVKEAINETGVTTAGPLGAMGRKIPGTGAYNLNKKLDAIRSNIGFAELQAMREASPTGGALGQVAVQELNMLQSVLGSLDTAQSPQQLEKNLYAIEKHYTNWKRAVKQAQQPDNTVRRYNPETGKIE